jgi:hypothetical protein
MNNRNIVQNRTAENSKIKILVCTHKQADFPQSDVFLPIQCGKAVSDVDLGIQGRI